MPHQLSASFKAWLKVSTNIKLSSDAADCLSRSYGSRCSLSYIIRDGVAVPTEVDDPLYTNSHFGASGSSHDELISRLPHTGAIYKNDNTYVYMKIEKAIRGTSVESTVQAFNRSKDGRPAFLALVANRAGDTKYRAISKKRMNLLQNIKWNGRSYPLESRMFRIMNKQLMI